MKQYISRKLRAKWYISVLNVVFVNLTVLMLWQCSTINTEGYMKRHASNVLEDRWLQIFLESCRKKTLVQYIQVDIIRNVSVIEEKPAKSFWWHPKIYLVGLTFFSLLSNHAVSLLKHMNEPKWLHRVFFVLFCFLSFAIFRQRGRFSIMRL